MDRRVRIAALALCVVSGFAVNAASQVGSSVLVRSADVTTTAGAIEIDGVLNEASWSSAPKIGELVQRQPDTGRAPTERTDVTLLRDEDHLYVGVYAYDAEPDRVAAWLVMDHLEGA